jgi:hypothetical protein
MLCQKLEILSSTFAKISQFVRGKNKRRRFPWAFLLAITEFERVAWIAFKSVVTKFLGNNKDPDYVTIVANMLEKFKVLECLISLNNFFFNSHLDFFPKILVQ